MHVARDPAAREVRLRAIVDEHYAFLWRTLRRLGVDASAAEDCAQHVLLVLSRRLEHVRPGSEKAFLLGTAVRVASDARKRQKKERARLEYASLDTHVSPAPNPEAQLDESRQRALLDELLARMPIELRTVFVLFELEELTMAAISELLELPPGTVASRLRRARSLFESMCPAPLDEERSR